MQIPVPLSRSQTRTRSFRAPHLVAIIGGAGFIGTALAEVFARNGWRIRVGCRQLHHARHLPPLGDVGQIGAVQADVRLPASLEQAVAGADLVINLAGIIAEKGQRLHDVHVEGAENVARAAADAGVPSLIHFSALGASPTARSAYARSKAEGESAVRAAFPDAVIIRPGLVFGPGDDFTNRIASLMMRSKFLPVIAGNTRVQPVHVYDVADAVLALANRSAAQTAGTTHEFAGPEVMTMRSLIARIAAASGREIRTFDLPGCGASLLAALPFSPVTRDQLRILGVDNVASGKLPGLDALGIVPTAFDTVASAWLGHYRAGGRFAA